MVGELERILARAQSILRMANVDDGVDTNQRLSYTLYYRTQFLAEHFLTTPEFDVLMVNKEMFTLCNTLFENFCDSVECFFSVSGGRYQKQDMLTPLYKGNTFSQRYKQFRKQASELDRDENDVFERYFCVRLHFNSTKDLNFFKIKHLNSFRKSFIRS